MRQIFSWTIGSFFRTIGRTLALLGMGALLYFILSKLGFGVKDLFLENVKADTQQASVWVNYYNDQAKETPLPSSGQFQYYEPSPNGNTFTGKNIFITTQTKTKDFDYILMPFQITGREYYNNADYLDREILCDWTAEQNANNDYEISSYDCRYWGTGNYNSPAPIQIHMNITLASSTSSAQSPCTMNEEGYLKCMLLPNVDYDKMILSYSLTNQNSTVPIRFNFGHVVGRYTSAIDRQQQAIEGVQQQQQQTNDKIQEQTEQQQQQHQEMMDANMTESNETASSFFNNFSDNDHGGLSSIVTAPLVVVNKMLDGTCTSPSATWKGATISLPCGDMFWSRPGAIDLKNLLNIFYGGFICYYAIRKLFLMIESLKDPTQDRIEVMDL